MKKLVFGAAIAALVSTASAAQADTFKFNFCGFAGDSDTCPDGVSEASLTFEEIANADPNDYTLTVKITGTAASGDFIDAIQFKYDGANTPDGYEDGADADAAGDVPTLTSAPAGTWTAFFGSIPNQCGPINEFTANSVCAVNTGANLSPAGTNTWVFTVDFVDSVAAIDEDALVNLRASFPKCNPSGNCSGGNLSPDGNYQFDTTGPQDTSGPVDTIGGPGNVPEPALLSLLGIGLVGAAARLRKRS